MKSYKTFKTELLKDKDIKSAYKELGPEFFIIQKLIEKRLRQGITQSELAKRAGTKQSAISRFESGKYNPSIHFLYRVADALDAKLKVTLS